jgi:catechol 2,3-dioxygenase-like lactoylglutathione lyase family enzyme
MKPRISVLTLGVDDLERSLTFYRDGLGFPTEGIVGKEFEHGAVAFFDLQAGVKLALWSRSDLAHETKVPLSLPSSTEMTIGHNVGSKQEVDAIMDQALRAGAVLADPAHDTFWGGYSGHFLDPDGHLWEVVWNPAWDNLELLPVKFTGKY